jgi:hypothetical protein
MSVLDTLSREHRLFTRLADRLENSVKLAEDAARSEMKNVLLLLLPALDTHEEIEDLVFGHPYAAQPGARVILAEVSAQHSEILALREDLLVALREAAGCPFAALSQMVLNLVQKLKLHFITEETGLWPHYAASRARNGALARQAERRVKDLETDVEKQSVMIADYLGRG